MIGRRPFLQASVLAGAAVAGLPLLGCGSSAALNAADSWNPDTIPDLDLHFDSSRAGPRIANGGHVASIPQLAPSGRCQVARQSTRARMPTLAVRSIGGRNALHFDGRSRTLTTHCPADTNSVTVVAVIRSKRSGGSIIGPNESDGGLQIRVDGDGSVIALDAGRKGIAQTDPAAVGDAPAIVAFSLDSVGNAQFYVDGRPSGAAVTDVSFPSGVTLAIGSAYRTEYFDGTVGEILRWTRPLTGAELGTVFEQLSRKWGVPEAGGFDHRPVVALRARNVKGSNIIPELADLAHDDPSASAWFNLWSRWNWEWIERSVKAAAGQGANTIRLIGDVNAVHSGTIDEATYHDRLRQVVELCKSYDCNFYYCAIDLRHKREADVGFITQFLSGVAGVLAQHDNVLAIELCNEVASGYQLYPQDDVVEWIAMWSRAIRSAAPNIPQSISDVAPGTLRDKIAATDYYALYTPLVDFFDLHVYDDLEMGSDSRILGPYELRVGLPLLIGEFGADRSVSGSDPGGFYAKVKTLRDSSPLVVGALQWGAVNDEFGLYSESTGQLEGDISTRWADF